VTSSGILICWQDFPLKFQSNIKSSQVWEVFKVWQNKGHFLESSAKVHRLIPQA